jgi:transposase
MVKFNTEDKLEAIQRYLQGNDSYHTIGDSIGATHYTIMNWVKQYEQHGVEAFNKSYTAYSVEFKLDVLNYMNNHGTSPNETAAIFNITSPALIRKWRTQVETKGIDALESKKKGRNTMKKKKEKITPVEGSVEALQAEIQDLRMEIAYLKKLNALVQNKETLQKKTKLK